MPALRRAILAAALTFSAGLLPAAAEDWPSRPIRIVVPFAAGGSTDVAARLVAEVLTRSLGQSVYVENRAGSNGVVGTEGAIKSPPDGYTILVSGDGTASNPHVYKVSHDPRTDLLPVIEISRQPIVLAAHPSLGAATLAELVAKAKAEPGMRYATGSGLGSGQHMVAQWFAHLAGITLEQVSYRGGGQAITDLVAGHVQLGSLGSTPLIPFYKDGSLKLLAQTTAERSPSLPDVPTFREAGFTELVVDQWVGAFVPAGTPPEIVARLNTEIGKALQEPSVRDKLVQLAQEPVGGSADDMGRLLRADYEKYGRLMHDLAIKVN